MEQLSKYDKEFLLECIRNGKEIPEEYKYALFPTKQKVYELVYAGKMRKEDILADNEEAKAVPLQVEKVFNGKKHPLDSKNWQNILVFGDNLQFLKTCYRNQDPLIKDKVKGKINLIYIDPPFGTGDQYDASKGQSAYSAKRKGADFVEFLRRRLFLLGEMLTDTGSIVVRMDYHFGHYVKVLLDEIFDKGNFRNEIIISRTRQGALNTQFESQRSMNVATDSLFWYSKNSDTRFKPFKREAGENAQSYWHTFWKPTDRPTLRYKIFGISPDRGQWLWKKERTEIAIKNYKEFLAQKELTLEEYWQKTGGTKEFVKKEEHLNSYNSVKYWIHPRDFVLANTDWTDIQGYSRTTGYPTENSEDLLARVIGTCTDEGDLVLDVFSGSGTTAAVAEKLSRRWIGCDIGKLSIYTTQKRLLTIKNSKDLDDKRGKYGKTAKSFCVVTAGLYDLGKIFNQVKDKYIDFVSQLFEVERLENKRIGGIEIDGKKGAFYVKIFPYWEFKDANVDEKYIEDLHKNIGKKIDERFYIIAPANSVDFITDYHLVGNVRYYFLKVPYQIIKELHKVQFKKLRQPQSKSNINDLEEAIGFHFIKQPEVKSKIEIKKDKVVLKLTKFYSQYTEEESHEELDNFESLAMVLIDLKYNGETFLMTDYYFADDLIKDKKKRNIGEDENLQEEIERETDETKIRSALKGQKKIKLEFSKQDCGKEIMAVYIDIYGNEFREILKVK